MARFIPYAISHWMKIKLWQHYCENICKNANKYDKLSKVIREVRYECATTMSSSTAIKVA